ncbi:uncharacterized protein MONBRDRAFT_32580 [Monosiga brevicollis MX1]|uniref:PCI domain-containing protein n=1 Tax=Monosiga brevicollis TaxID=81824 RepID=A9V0G6_MONBE|nr:uncharacterized protein MONBRDRAFT_32580 [Monosiga brevicollis MX1]EDQ89152.1 predicted protein [Monosiga brevicollis MX1]|eukprot:XP_001746257.1 hypothetical protein [Monosiga brevicollis MX1]
MAAAYLESQIAKHAGETAELWQEVETLYTRKLWHQLTQKLLEMVQQPMFADDGLVQLYEQFISDFASKINQVSYVHLCLVVATQIETPEQALEFLGNIKNQVTADTAATVLVQAAIAELHLRLNHESECQAQLREAEKLLDQLDGVTEMHGSYYRVAAEYHKHKANFAEFYINALRFLGCTDINTLPVEDQVQRAFDLSLAALLGEGIYNFGELLSHDILNALRDTDKAWLVELLFAFNAGDLQKFEALDNHWKSSPDLAANTEVLGDKIRLLALMELVFKSPPHMRDLKFDTIAQAANVTEEAVERLVMRAMALGLVRGAIDQVEGLAKLNWVQPRVLDLQQVGALADRFATWCEAVNEASQQMELQAPELFVQ